MTCLVMFAFGLCNMTDHTQRGNDDVDDDDDATWNKKNRFHHRIEGYFGPRLITCMSSNIELAWYVEYALAFFPIQSMATNSYFPFPCVCQNDLMWVGMDEMKKKINK